MLAFDEKVDQTIEYEWSNVDLPHVLLHIYTADSEMDTHEVLETSLTSRKHGGARAELLNDILPRHLICAGAATHDGATSLLAHDFLHQMTMIPFDVVDQHCGPIRVHDGGFDPSHVQRRKNVCGIAPEVVVAQAHGNHFSEGGTVFNLSQVHPTTSTDRNTAFATYLCGIGAGSAPVTLLHVFRAAQQTFAFAVDVAHEFGLPLLVCVHQLDHAEQRTVLVW